MDYSNHSTLPTVKKNTALLCLLALLAIPASGFANDDNEDKEVPRVALASPSPWSGSIGLAFRKFSGGTFHSGSSASAQTIQTDNGSFSIEAMAAGDATGQALRNYDDGFVGPDTLGTLQGSVFEGTTSRFGFDSNDQVQGGSLLFQSSVTGVQTVSSMSYSSESLLVADDPDYEAGMEININYALPRSSESFKLSLDMGLLYSPYQLNSLASNYAATRTDTTEEFTGTLTDAYAFPSGVTPPNAPYSQPDMAPGPSAFPRIEDIPTRTVDSTTVLSSSQSITRWTNLLDQHYDADVYSFYVGPRLSMELGERLSWDASLGASIHLTHWDGMLHENFYQQVDGGSVSTVGTWNASNDGTDFLLGAYLQGAVAYRFGRNEEYHIQGFARWDWAQSQQDSLGTSTFDISYDAFTAGISLGIAF